MYIIEFLIKKIFYRKSKPKNEQEKELEKCEHIFLPIDSSAKTLACTKCGILTELKTPKN